MSYLIGEQLSGGYGEGADIIRDCTISVDKGQLNGALVICSTKSSTNSGSKRCNASNKIKHRYLVQIDRSLNIEIYKYILKKNKWALQ